MIARWVKTLYILAVIKNIITEKQLPLLVIMDLPYGKLVKTVMFNI